ncbi:hypothetical protein BACINT_00641 [Bacteroides intestinalis DSM 17393]|uniref:Uncharacterized protein n=1 Tax=Bacteroides intestinalis DSM 17393 TaxID=471870 RepID=B3C6V2_9BACE|nr:hypothetical protein BACINT_00641 [Bacteroides intestinalis DSM 17393]
MKVLSLSFSEANKEVQQNKILHNSITNIVVLISYIYHNMVRIDNL